ncbi:MAG: AmmeMemoRadiSam system radical SAM enzyme [Planctomycetales bacterium]|nr:AmmeMemoRadiSam system radical SAM enzyme [Planctomycetales bacterium]
MRSRIVTTPPVQSPFADGAIVGGWWRDCEDDPGKLLCELCPRACRLKPGDRGFCFVRENRDGQMALTTYGRSTGFCIDPIEKKPLNHFYPGTPVLSFGTAGCNLGCRFCQNWDISKSREVERLSAVALPDAIAAAALQNGCRSVAFTYNDPVIWAEYAIDVAHACRAAGVKTVAVTAGYITEAAREPFFAAMDGANIDLKAFSETFYHQLTASHLQPVLDTLSWVRRETNVWFEITNLLIPDANDSDDELRRMCEWIVRELGEDVPVHFTAFHPDFRMRDRGATPHETLLRARELARNQGIRFAYVGNVNDVAHQSTYCPGCGELLIERNWYELGRYALQGCSCSRCGAAIPGRFDDKPGDWGRRRLPLNMAAYEATTIATRPEPESPRVPPPQSPPNDTTRTTSDSMNATVGTGTGANGLTELQWNAIRRATLELMRGATAGRSEVLSDPTLGGAATRVIEGIFTTVKRGDTLRGCCGVLGQPMTLLDALRQAAERTAIHDTRMPPISPRELPWLELDISILHSFRAAPGDAAARRAAVELGRHGLRIQRGQQAGLLLPMVPIEHGWDLETYFRQLCRKAGLPSTAWEDPQTQLVSFEAEVGEGRWPIGPTESFEESPFLTGDEVDALRQHARGNVIAHATGATPMYYLPGCPDGTVQGLALRVELDGRAPLSLTRFDLRPGLPMQATLQELTREAARRLPPVAVSGQLKVEVAVFTRAGMHGSAQEGDLRGFDIRRHAVLVLERGKSGWACDADAEPSQLLTTACHQARVKSAEQAQVFSLDCSMSPRSMAGGTAPAAIDLATPRPPAVAGSFYPSDPAEMRATLDKLFGELVEPQSRASVMVPHAGWRYSGHIAADVLKRTRIPRRVLVIGPKHRRGGVEWAIAPHDRWLIPGGEVAADRQWAERLAAAVPGWELDAEAHREEHGIEVELPLLARLRPDVQVTGVALAGGTWEQAAATATALADALRQLDELPLLVVSSDMNHFAPDAENRRLDQLALNALATGDGRALLDVCSQHSISMCGVFPAAIVLETLRRLGRTPQPAVISYATSADVTGDTSRVVGYAGALLAD